MSEVVAWTALFNTLCLIAQVGLLIVTIRGNMRDSTTRKQNRKRFEEYTRCFQRGRVNQHE